MSRSIIKKALGIGSSTLLSRFVAYFREVLMMQFNKSWNDRRCIHGKPNFVDVK